MNKSALSQQKTCYQMLKDCCDLKKGCIVFSGHKISMKTFLKNIEDFSSALFRLGLKKVTF